MATCSTSQDGARSKVCAVCKCDSESYHLNYGASTCFRWKMSMLLTFAPSFAPNCHCLEFALNGRMDNHFILATLQVKVS